MPRWTDAAREKQRQLIHQWKPWERSTGPRTPKGKAIASRNAEKPPNPSLAFLEASREMRFAVGDLANLLRRQRLSKFRQEVERRDVPQ